MKNYFRLVTLFLLAFVLSRAQTYTPVAVSGYNIDAIAESGTNSQAQTTQSLDWSNHVMYNATFAGSAALACGGIINSGTIVSGTRTYQLAAYTGNNTFYIASGATQTITLVTPAQFSRISLLTFSTEGSSSINVTFNYTNGSVAMGSFTVADWFFNAGAVYSGFGRCTRLTAGVTANGCTSDPRFYPIDFNIPCNDQQRVLQSITINTTFGNQGAYVMAVSGVSFTQTNTINPIVNVNCNGGNNGSATAVITGTNSPFTYSWNSSPVQTTATASNLPAGNYTCTVTDSKGCVTTSTVSITAPPALTLTLTPVNPTCGLSNGSISASASGGTPTYSFSVNGGAYAAGSSFTSLGAGTFNISVQDSKGCITTQSSTLTNTAPPVLSVNSATVCAGSSATLTASGAATYVWSPGTGLSSTSGSTVTATPASTTIYTITGTAANTCTASITSTVTVNALPVPSANNTGPYCPGNTIALSSAGGATYSWSGPASFSSATQNPTINNAATNMSGNFSVTVTSAAGCTATATTSVTVNPTPSATASNSGPYCLGSNVVLSAGGGGTYSWSGPNSFTSASQNPTVGAATAVMNGIYTVTVTLNSCTATATTSVSINAAMVPGISSNSPICANTSLNLFCTNGVNWTWSGPNGFSSALQNPVISNATTAESGTYSITVTDASGCSGTGTVSVTVNALPNVIVNSIAICSGDTAQLLASGANSYAWSTGTIPSTGNSVNASPLSNTTYTVTGTDLNGCVSTAVSSVTINALPAITVNSLTVCPNVTGTLTANGAQNYSWSAGTTPATGNVVSVTAAATTQFTVSGTDANGCTDSAVAVVTVASQLFIDAGLNDTVCKGAAFTLNASGGTGTTFTWMPGNLAGSTQNLTANTNTTYTVSGTDINGCTGSDTVIITVPPTLILQAAGFPATCNGLCNGQVVILASPSSGTFAQYQYAWSNGANTPSVNNMCAGTYTVLVTDAAGCSDTVSTTVTQPTALTASAPAVSNASCNAVCDGSATINVSGGTAPYTYAWSSIGTGNNPLNLCAGNYTCTINDNNNCSTTVQLSITEPLPISVSIAPVSNICIGQTAFLNSSPSGGNGSYTFTWSGGNVNPAGAQNVTANPVATTTYSLSVSDVNGCAPGTATVTVNVAGPLSINATAVAAICAGQTQNLNALATGGNGVYTYTWQGGTNPSSGSAVACTPTQSTTYTVTVTDGCGTPSATDSVAVTVNPLPTLSIVPSLTAGCAPLCVDFTSQSNPQSVLCNWSFTNNQSANGNCTPHICFNTPGNYGAALTVTDINGCTNTVSTANIISVYPVPTAAFNYTPEHPDETQPLVSFQDQTTGAVLAGWSWSFDGGATFSSVLENPQYDFQSAGNYTVDLIVLSDHGCSDTVEHVVIVDPQFVIYVPNAFTPSTSHGKNDVFLPKGTGIDTENYEMRIYDRWGNEIFYSKDFSIGWDGKVNGGTEFVQEDVYVWKINLRTFDGTKKSYVGHVTVVK